MEKVVIKRLNSNEYFLYDDMVYWRTNGHERSVNEKSKLFDSNDYIKNQLSKDYFHVYIALVDDRAVGWIHAVEIPKIGRWTSSVLYVDELWVAPSYRNKGIGMLLCERVNSIKSEIGAEAIRLYADNPEAIRLYERCGWKVSSSNVTFLEDK